MPRCLGNTIAAVCSARCNGDTKTAEGGGRPGHAEGLSVKLTVEARSLPNDAVNAENTTKLIRKYFSGKVVECLTEINSHQVESGNTMNHFHVNFAPKPSDTQILNLGDAVKPLTCLGHVKQ